MCKRISVWINGLITEDKGYPLCYTAYDRKSHWYKIFDKCMFWDPQHCRRTWLARRIHDRVYMQIKRSDYDTLEDWNKAVYELDKKYTGPCLEGYRWVRSEHFKWTPDGDYKNWVITLEMVRRDK